MESLSLSYGNDSAVSDSDNSDSASLLCCDLDAFLVADMQSSRQEHEDACSLLSDINSAHSLSRKRLLCASLLGLVVQKRKRREYAAKLVMYSNASLLQSYIKLRGGDAEMEVFDIPDVKFDLDSVCPKEAFAYFRFSCSELRRVCKALRIPSVVVSSEQDKCSGLEVFAMMCMNYAYPGRQLELVKRFGTSTPRISRLIKALRSYLFETFYPGMCRPKLIPPSKMQEFEKAIYDQCGVNGIFGFIDATVRPTCKPELFQNVVYNGKDKTHALKYQVLCTPDGIMRHVSGPYCGSRHDQHMVHKSDVLGWVTKHPRSPEGLQYVIYADAGYAIAPGLMRPFADERINITHKAANEIMSSVRICVEWEFGDIVNYWAAVNFKPRQVISNGSRPGQQYIIAALLSNCRNCLSPCRTSQYFDCPPPVLEDYVESLTNLL
jgi:nuclease HARBI1